MLKEQGGNGLGERVGDGPRGRTSQECKEGRRFVRGGLKGEGQGLEVKG